MTWLCMRCSKPTDAHPLVFYPDGTSEVNECDDCGCGWWVPAEPTTYSDFGIATAEEMLKRA